MNSHPSIAGRGAVLMGVAALLLGAAQSARAGVAGALGLGASDDRVGPFEINLHHGSHWVGHWESKTHTVRYSIRHRGKRVELPAAPGPMGEDRGTERRFDLLLAIDGSRPALIVGTGGMQYAHNLWLLFDQAGELRSERMGPERGDVPGTIEWLDGTPIELTPAKERVKAPRLSGGRWLLPGRYAVLDTQALAIHRLAEPTVPVYGTGVLWRSPDDGCFVRDGGGGTEPLDYLVVFDIVRGTSEALPLDPQRMPHGREEFTSLPWLQRHFEWVARKDGGFRLVARAAAAP